MSADWPALSDYGMVQSVGKLPQAPRARPSLLSRLRDAAALNIARAGATLRDLRLPLPPPARLVFHPEYVDFPLEAGPRHSFDVRRPARILEKLQSVGVLSSDQVLEPEPISRADLELTHSPAFLDEVFDQRQLARLLHLQPDLVLMENPIDLFRRQAGGTLLAAERAVRDRAVTFNLGGGFHHAQRDRAEGFCPINDVAVAIEVLRKRRLLVRRVLVVDLDYHHGNGTALIFSNDEDVFTLSVHGQSWAAIDSKRNNLDVELPPGTGDSRYLEAVREALTAALRRFSPQLAIYLAGADPLAGDRLGDFRVSESALLERDLFVWQTLDRHGVPLAVLLAGGYGMLAWTVPYNFIFSVLTGSPIRERYRPSNIAAQYWRIHHSIPVERLVADSGELTAEDVQRTFEQRDTNRFLDFYSQQGLDFALERYGIYRLLRDQGFEDLKVSIDTSDRARHRLRIHFGGLQDSEHLLIELVASIGSIELPEGERCRILDVGWLCMQDPRQAFSLERPPLPGQRHPGLGISRWVVEVLRMMALRLGCEGLANNPDRYHNAFLYAKVMRYFDPADEGLLLALERDLSQLSLLEATLAIEDGRVHHLPGGEPLHWQGRPQVLAISRRLRAYFERDAYAHAVGRQRDVLRFGVAQPDDGASQSPPSQAPAKA